MTDNQQPKATRPSDDTLSRPVNPKGQGVVPTTGADQHLDASAVASRGHGNPTQVHDPGSDLVDTEDPNLVTDTVPEVEEMKVFYAFAGAGIAGQNLSICDRCSSIVREDMQDSHTQWHRNGGQ